MQKLLNGYIAKLLVFFLLLVTGYLLPVNVRADELEEIAKKISDLERARQMSIEATRPLEQELGKKEAEIERIQNLLDQAVLEIKNLEESILQREKDFETHYALLASRVESYYKSLRKPSEFILILFQKDQGEWLKDLSYRQAAAEEDKKIISQISQDLLVLESDKKRVEEDSQRLASLQVRFDEEAEFFRVEIKGAKEYQQELSSKIAELTARQRAILAEKAGTFQISVGEVPLTDDLASRPDFNPGFSPAFAAFSFGAPHFKGMSQYGAFGRAKHGGQNYEQILRAYYGDIRIETVDTNLNLPTVVGSLPFEDNYLKGIAEMPTQWADEGGYEALKAQAIAARSYALAYTGWRMGDRTPKSAICVTENCQVYRSSKAANPGRWGEAVNDTRGQIMVSNPSGEVVNAWYASTSGGYQESYSSLGHTTPAFWDAEGGRGGWTSNAWENRAGSPWFYKGWYKSRSGDACGRSHPWLTEEEMSDVLNGWVVLRAGSDDRVSPIGPCWGGNPYSLGELRDKANEHGGAFGSISSLAVVYAENGITSSVTFNTNRGAVTIEGLEFKKIFNLRAPGRISLKSGLFNIEKK